LKKKKKKKERISQRSNKKSTAKDGSSASTPPAAASSPMTKQKMRSAPQQQQASQSQQQQQQQQQPEANKLGSGEQKEAKKAQLIMNRYQVGEAIGKGGFATVYRALDTERGDFVAIKQIEKRFCFRTCFFVVFVKAKCFFLFVRLLASEQLPKIMQEAELLKKLSHPNVVGFRGSVETSKHISFVLEFVEGGSLYRVVKKFGTFTEKLCAIYLKQVLMGLAYLHEQGVVHRDIVRERSKI
jgi:hypothetical protein